MIGLDTNVLIRYFMEDDEDQAHAATQAIAALTEDEPGFVSIVVLVEMVWVLLRSYRLPQDEILPLIDDILRTRELQVQHAEIVHQAIRAVRATSADFADSLISGLAASAGCDSTVTFDRAAARLPGMTLLKASKTA